MDCAPFFIAPERLGGCAECQPIEPLSGRKEMLRISETTQSLWVVGKPSADMEFRIFAASRSVVKMVPCQAGEPIRRKGEEFTRYRGQYEKEIDR